MDFTKGDLAKPMLIKLLQWFSVSYDLLYPSFDAFYKCSFEIENLVTSYKLPKDYFSKVFCTIILYLQPFQILKWRKVYGGYI